MVRGNEMEGLTSLIVLEVPSKRHFGGFSQGQTAEQEGVTGWRAEQRDRGRGQWASKT